jgi:ATP-dependent DNA helicase Rep
MVAGVPSRFLAEMKLAEDDGARADPRARLKALRDAAARRAEGATQAGPVGPRDAPDRDPPVRTA